MKNLSPEQAWEKVKATNPNAKYIYRVLRDGWAVEPREPGIDWPEGVDRWPPPEPRWREPTMADVGKMVEVRDNTNTGWNGKGKLLHRTGDNFVVLSTAGFGSNWMHARIKDEGAAT